MGKPGASETSAWKIIFLNASRVRQAVATNKAAVELPTEEQAKSSYPRTVHNWEMKRQNVRGFIYGDDFIFVRINIKTKADDDDQTVAQITRDFFAHGRQKQVISEQRDVKVSRVDAGSVHAERILTRTITVEGWMQSTRRFSVAGSEFNAEVKGCVDFAWSEKHDG